MYFNINQCELKVEKSSTMQREENGGILKYANENRNAGFFNDVTIKAENVCLSANCMVLSYFSPYFEKMFKTNMKEKYKKTVEIQNFDGETLQKIIDYIYTGEVLITNKNVVKLLAAADYIQVDSLKKFCFEFLDSIITEDTCCIILKILKLYSDETLKKNVEKFISHHLQKLSESSDFKTFSHEELLTCLQCFDSSQENKPLYDAIITWVSYNKESRISRIPKLLKLIDLNKIPLEFLRKVISKENLILDNLESAIWLVKALSQSPEQEQIFIQNSNTKIQEKHPNVVASSSSGEHKNNHQETEKKGPISENSNSPSRNDVKTHHKQNNRFRNFNEHWKNKPQFRTPFSGNRLQGRQKYPNNRFSGCQRQTVDSNFYEHGNWSLNDAPFTVYCNRPGNRPGIHTQNLNHQDQYRNRDWRRTNPSIKINKRL